MTAIFATLLAPSVPTARSQRRGRSSALLLAALVLSACGGRSVRHDDPDAGNTLEGNPGTATGGTSGGGGQQTHPTTANTTPVCRNVCTTCLGTSSGSCATLCDTIVAGAQQAGCLNALSSLLDCQQAAGSGCSVDACASQNNSLTVCVLDYCDDHPSDAVCVAPL
jgi:hypothetical protein